jgi:hypothetical protein
MKTFGIAPSSLMYQSMIRAHCRRGTDSTELLRLVSDAMMTSSLPGAVMQSVFITLGSRKMVSEIQRMYELWVQSGGAPFPSIDNAILMVLPLFPSFVPL